MRAVEGRSCPLCEAPLHAARLEPCFGDEAPLRLTLRSMPVLRCATGHAYFAHPRFALWLLRHLVDEREATLPAGKASGLLLKRYACGGCGARLPRSAAHPHSFGFEVAFEETPPFAVELSMPVYGCSACGKEQLRSLEEVRALTAAALVHAFKAAGLKAPG